MLVQRKDLNINLRNKMEKENKPNRENEKKPLEAPKKVEASVSEAPAGVEKKSEKKELQKERSIKSEAIVETHNVPISTKKSAAICKFIKKKKIEVALAELDLVSKLKKAVPMKGEIPHRKGKIMAGRFPKNASLSFIKLLKSLSANADYNGLKEPVIVEAIANIGSRPYGRFGQARRKRTHVRLVAKDLLMKGAKK